MEEVVHFLHADRTIFVGVHRFKDAFVSRLKLLQGDGSVTIAIHQREDDAHGERLHHTSLSHGVPQPLSHHFIPSHALPHAMPHPSVPIRIRACILVHGVLLRLLQQLDVWGFGIILSAGGYTAANQNGCGCCYHEKMPFHRSLLYGYWDMSLRLNSIQATLIPSHQRKPLATCSN
jgi:hypothetical protein